MSDINLSDSKNLAVESEFGDFITLLKPRVMALVVFTSITGLILAPGNIHPFIASTAILSIALGAGAAGALNMWYDRDIDILMERTKYRPIPAGKIAPEEALSLGIILSFIAVIIMAACVNYLSAAVLLFTIFFYSYIYSVLLKRHTAQNIVIGGAAGSIPPINGWVAVTGELDLMPIWLFLIIFFWTPPHFWALALKKSSEYQKANVPMLPAVAGEIATKKQILAYTIITCLTSLLPLFSGAGRLYLIFAMGLGAGFLYFAAKLLRSSESESLKYAMPLFGYSILYLFMLFLSLILDKFFG
jgi:protoheme IX farnesyltransferase